MKRKLTYHFWRHVILLIFSLLVTLSFFFCAVVFVWAVFKRSHNVIDVVLNIIGACIFIGMTILLYTSIKREIIDKWHDTE